MLKLTVAQRLRLICSLGLLLIAPLAAAHKLVPSLLQLTVQSHNDITVLWKTPADSAAARSLQPVFPADCVERSTPEQSTQGTAVVLRWTLSCEGGLVGKTIRVEGMTSSATATLVNIHWNNGRRLQQLINAGSAQFTVPAQQTDWQVAFAYWLLGLQHIWAGLDHLLFVLALVLLVPTLRRLIWTITAFTLGHSITLSLATLEFIHFPSAMIEILIAASIWVMAVELAQGEINKHRNIQTARWIPNHSWVVAVAFGLLHGMGFAGALKEIGLPEQDIALALLSFNIGIEVGQIAFVLLCLALAMMVTRVFKRWQTVGWWASVYSIGALSVMWCIERSL